MAVLFGIARGVAVIVSPQRKGPVILCVEDEPSLLELRKLQFEGAGYDVLAAASPEEALEAFATEHVDLVFTDYLLPRINGAELASRMKQLKPDVPIVLTSGVLECPEDATGVVDLFVAKPTDTGELISAIAALLPPAQRYGT